MKQRWELKDLHLKGLKLFPQNSPPKRYSILAIQYCNWEMRSRKMGIMILCSNWIEIHARQAFLTLSYILPALFILRQGIKLQFLGSWDYRHGAPWLTYSHPPAHIWWYWAFCMLDKCCITDLHSSCRVIILSMHSTHCPYNPYLWVKKTGFSDLPKINRLSALS